MTYLKKTPALLRWSYPKRIWRMPTQEVPSIYLTFDDGPIPEITPWVLEQLAAYRARATFFCIGDNIDKHPDVFEQLKASGHSLGNHTYHHISGWSTNSPDYLSDIARCAEKIPVRLFRPPYGKMRSKQGRQLRRLGHEIIMWDIISGDFDKKNTAEHCFQHVKAARNGSIIVFHDSQKSWPRLREVLPRTLEYFSAKGYRFAAL